MNATISAELSSKDPSSAALVQGLDSVLDDALSPLIADRRWTLEPDHRDRPLIVLKVGDKLGGEGSTAFAPEELKHKETVRSRVYHLGGAVVRVSQWRDRVKHLFDEAREWAKSYPITLDVREEPITVRERASGQYPITRLVLGHGRRTMFLEPIGAWIIDAEGRVDALGIGGPFVLLFSKGEWNIIEYKDGVPSSRLTKESFLEIVKACLDDD